MTLSSVWCVQHTGRRYCVPLSTFDHNNKAKDRMKGCGYVGMACRPSHDEDDKTLSYFSPGVACKPCRGGETSLLERVRSPPLTPLGMELYRRQKGALVQSNAPSGQDSIVECQRRASLVFCGEISGYSSLPRDKLTNSPPHELEHCEGTLWPMLGFDGG